MEKPEASCGGEQDDIVFWVLSVVVDIIWITFPSVALDGNKMEITQISHCSADWIYPGGTTLGVITELNQ